MSNLRSVILRTINIFIVVSVLSSCVGPGSIKISKEKVNSLGTVSFAKVIKEPDSFRWRGGGEAWGAALFGVLGAIAGGDSEKPDKDLISDLLKQNNINITEIVYKEAKSKIEAMNRYSLADKNDTKASFVFTVDMYGFNKTHPFGSVMNPIIRLTGSLVSKNKEVLWRESEFVSDLSSDINKGKTFDEYINNPENLRAALENAAQVAVSRIVETLDEEKPEPDDNAF